MQLQRPGLHRRLHTRRHPQQLGHRRTARSDTRAPSSRRRRGTCAACPVPPPTAAAPDPAVRPPLPPTARAAPRRPPRSAARRGAAQQRKLFGPHRIAPPGGSGGSAAAWRATMPRPPGPGGPHSSPAMIAVAEHHVLALDRHQAMVTKGDPIGIPGQILDSSAGLRCAARSTRRVRRPAPAVASRRMASAPAQHQRIEHGADDHKPTASTAAAASPPHAICPQSLSATIASTTSHHQAPPAEESFASSWAQGARYTSPAITTGTFVKSSTCHRICRALQMTQACHYVIGRLHRRNFVEHR